MSGSATSYMVPKGIIKKFKVPLFCALTMGQVLSEYHFLSS